MKAETAWNELRRVLEQEGHYALIETMDKLEKQEEPDYIYRYTYDSPYYRSRPLTGSKHRMRCLVNARSGYGNSLNNIKIERAPVNGWTDVTKDFVK